MKLGVVGHAADKFVSLTEGTARHAIGVAIMHYRPTHLVSGHSPMGGVDIWAEDAAHVYDLEMIVHAPAVNKWDAPGGFKDRNLAIAEDSDHVLVVVVKDYDPSYKGMTFDYCYHCHKRISGHVKSGGCWTAWKAKSQEWAIVDGDTIVWHLPEYLKAHKGGV